MKVIYNEITKTVMHQNKTLNPGAKAIDHRPSSIESSSTLIVTAGLVPNRDQSIACEQGDASRF